MVSLSDSIWSLGTQSILWSEYMQCFYIIQAFLIREYPYVESTSYDPTSDEFNYNIPLLSALHVLLFNQISFTIVTDMLLMFELMLKIGILKSLNLTANFTFLQLLVSFLPVWFQQFGLRISPTYFLQHMKIQWKLRLYIN